MTTQRLRVLHVGTASISVSLMRGQLKSLREAGFEVIVATAPGPELAAIAKAEGIQSVEVPMAREITPIRDLAALFRLYVLLRRIRPAIINFGTPKAGLIAGLAAWLSRVPCRVYTLRGLRAETTTGFKRRLLLLSEKIACACTHRVICVSESLRRLVLSLELTIPERTVVFGSGSSNGVEEAIFAPTGDRLRAALELRQELGIPGDAPVLGFVGRLTQDKGVVELLDAFRDLKKEFPELRLLLLGPFEEGDALPEDTRRAIRSDTHIICPGFVTETACFYHAIDVLVLPTHREGFPNAVLEAHAAGRPVVASRATGVVDAVVDEVTGLLVPIGDSEALGKAIGRILKDPELARRLGNAGRMRVLLEFNRETIWHGLLQEYRQLLRNAGLPEPYPVRGKAKGLPLPVASISATESVRSS